MALGTEKLWLAVGQNSFSSSMIMINLVAPSHAMGAVNGALLRPSTPHLVKLVSSTIWRLAPHVAYLYESVPCIAFATFYHK